MFVNSTKIESIKMGQFDCFSGKYTLGPLKEEKNRNVFPNQMK